MATLSPPFLLLLLQSTWLLMKFAGERPPQSSVNMQGFYSKLDSSSSSSSSPLLGVGREGSRIPLSLAVEAEKAQALLQTFSSASLLASAGLGAFCVVADHALQLPAIQNHLWLRAALDNATHGLVGLWSWAVVIGLRKKSDVYEVLLAGFLASIIDLDHFYMAGSLSLKVRPRPPGYLICKCVNVEKRGRGSSGDSGVPPACYFAEHLVVWYVLYVGTVKSVRSETYLGSWVLLWCAVWYSYCTDTSSCFPPGRRLAAPASSSALLLPHPRPLPLSSVLHVDRTSQGCLVLPAVDAFHFHGDAPCAWRGAPRPVGVSVWQHSTAALLALRQHHRDAPSPVLCAHVSDRNQRRDLC